MKTIPTLLTLDKFELMDQLELFQKYFDRIQIDVADGILVPNITTQIDELTEVASQGHIEIPSNIAFDFHLMTKNFKAELHKIVDLMKHNVNVRTVLINASLRPKLNELSQEYDFAIGLDISPEQEIEPLVDYYNLSKVPAIQVMTVKPGFQGSPFLAEMLMKIQQLRELDYRGEILIDGGVNSNSLPIVSSQKYRPDILCIGSYLTKSGDLLEERISELKKLEDVE